MRYGLSFTSIGDLGRGRGLQVQLGVLGDGGDGDVGEAKKGIRDEEDQAPDDEVTDLLIGGMTASFSLNSEGVCVPWVDLHRTRRRTMRKAVGGRP